MISLFVSQKRRVKEEKKNQLAIKRTSENELCWEAVMIYQHGSQPAPPFLPIVPRKQIAITRYLLAQYSHRFPKLNTAKVFVNRAIKKFKDRPDNKAPFRDKRGENRARTKRNNPEAIELTEQILLHQKLRPKRVVQALLDRGIVIHDSTIRRIMCDLQIHRVKPWYTDVLTSAQKFKRVIFIEPLLAMRPGDLLLTLMSWMNTDEKW